MLVLSRQRDESIIIGDNIVITVVDIRGDKVRLGIDAPREVSVHREEVYNAIKRKEAEEEVDQSTLAGLVGDDRIFESQQGGGQYDGPATQYPIDVRGY